MFALVTHSASPTGITLASLLREGAIQPLISLEANIRDAAAAITAMTRRSVEGRVVLVVD